MFFDTGFLSFGGGVQSTALVLMLIKNPEIFDDLDYEKPRHIIFADTGAEPDYVLENVNNVFDLVANNSDLNCHIVRAKDSILDDNVRIGRGITTPPYFTKNEIGEIGILRRQCTSIYKIDPITKKQRELLGYKPRQRIPKNHAFAWLGISIEEANRAKASIFI